MPYLAILAALVILSAPLAGSPAVAAADGVRNAPLQLVYDDEYGRGQLGGDDQDDDAGPSYNDNDDNENYDDDQGDSAHGAPDDDDDYGDDEDDGITA